MFVEERHDAILALLRKQGKVLVKNVSEEFGVTEDCIRKDLTLLEKKGLLKRAYGGAIPCRTNPHREDVFSRKEENVEQKKLIAQKAFSLIQNGYVVFLDISTSNIELVQLLLESRLEVTIATNMVEIMRILSVPCNIELIFIGGKFTRSKDGFVGTLSIEIIDQLKFDLAFLGTVGIDPNNQAVYTYLIEDGHTKKAIIRNSRKSYVLAESAKFRMDGNFKYASIKDFNGIITDSEIDKETSRLLKNTEIELI